jgi:hypothetical protein
LSGIHRFWKVGDVQATQAIAIVDPTPITAAAKVLMWNVQCDSQPCGVARRLIDPAAGGV